MANWKRKSIDVERVYEITDAPDLQDDTETRRRVIRPRKVTLHQVFDTSLVRGAVIEGRQVRRDGQLAGSMTILTGIEKTPWGYSATPPEWLNKILADEGLEWTSSR